MHIIVGLGNPGKRYENTRHNVGFVAIDQLAERLCIKVNKIKHKALIGEGFIDREKIILVKPQTYMNLSGESVREIVDYYKINMENLVVIYDDIDIEMGTVRIRKKGSAGTHNGMRSVIRLLGKDSFPRVRIGIGKSYVIPLTDFVIGGFTKGEKEPMEKAVLRCVDGVISIVEDGIDLAMNRYNMKK